MNMHRGKAGVRGDGRGVLVAVVVVVARVAVIMMTILFIIKLRRSKR